MPAGPDPALQLAATRPELTEPEFRHAPAAADLSDGTAGAALLRALTEHAQVGWTAGHLVAAHDQHSIIGRLLRRQLAAAGQLDAPALLVGATRAHPAARGLTSTAVAAWATAQQGLTWHGWLLELPADQSRWLQPTDRQVLSLFSDRHQAARPDLLRVLTGCGLTLRSASQWVVRCPWLRPAPRRGTYRPASPTPS